MNKEHQEFIDYMVKNAVVTPQAILVHESDKAKIKELVTRGMNELIESMFPEDSLPQNNTISFKVPVIIYNLEKK